MVRLRSPQAFAPLFVKKKWKKHIRKPGAIVAKKDYST